MQLAWHLSTRILRDLSYFSLLSSVSYATDNDSHSTCLVFMLFLRYHNATVACQVLATMTQLNKVGQQLAEVEGVHAMTDVTGFGLCGHLLEVARGSGLAACVDYSKV